MTRRIIAVALIVLGLIAILAAIASATLWRPTDTATLTTPARPEAAVVVSDPGVLDAVADQVTITATADDDEPVTLVLARTEDVEAWLGTDAHTRITGLASWDELEVTDVEAEPTEAPTDEATGEPTEEATATEAATGQPEDAPATVPNPAGADLWVVEQTGTGTAEIEWEAVDGRWSLLAATDGTTPAPTVALTWPVDVRTPWLVPGLIVGAVLLLAGLALLALEILTERETRRRQAVAAERTGRRADSDAEETAVLPAQGAAAGATGLTRRELREREKAEARNRGRRSATGEIPVVAEAEPTDNEDVRDAGAARGAGIVPGSTRADELRAGRDEPEAAAPPEPAFLPGGDVPGEGSPTAAGLPGAEPGAGADITADREAAGVTRGAGIVPASIRASEHRSARERGVEAQADTDEFPAVGDADTGTEETTPTGRRSPEEDAAWTADADGLEEAGDTPAGDRTADESPDAQGDEEEAPSWRSMWGFADRDRSADETEEPR